MSTKDNIREAKRILAFQQAGLPEPIRNEAEARATLAAYEAAERGEGEAKRLEAEQRRDELLHGPQREHQDRARDIAAIRRRLRTSAQRHLERGAAEVRGREDKRLSDQAYGVFRRAVSSALEDLQEEAALAEVEHEHRVAVVHEPPVYGPHSEHSWFRDLAASLSPPGEVLGARTEEMAPAAVEARLAMHAKDVQSELRRGTPYGRAVRAMLHEASREENEHEHRQRADRDVRALITGGGATASASGGGAAAFVSPAWLTALWAPFRGIERSFADACHKEPLPDWGLQLYVPVFTGTDKVAKQSDGGSVTETTPTTGLEGAKLETLTGQVIISQQLLDRAVTGGGGGFDELLGRELSERLAQETDLYALNEAISKGEAVTGETTYSTKGLYKDLALAREKLTDTAGTRLRPTHMWSTSDLYSFASRQVDSTTERPILQPWFAPGFPISTGADAFDGGPKPPWSRFTGTVMPAGVLWFTNDNIPVVGTSTRTQIIVSAPATALVLVEGEPIVTAFRETLAHQLEVVVNLRNYVAVITRHAAGTAVVSSSAYTTGLL
jgi:hypothetical protein